MENLKYYFILASENFLFNQEPLEEVLRERVQNYNKKEKLLNFWIVPNPNFLNHPSFIEIKNNSPKNPVAIISTEKTFITWLKLRLNNVAIGSFDMIKDNQISPLKSIS
jgi:hypothetical protein